MPSGLRTPSLGSFLLAVLEPFPVLTYFARREKVLIASLENGPALIIT